MCTSTIKLKLCTCKFGKRLPDNYWILHRFTTANEITIGEIICDYNRSAIVDNVAIAAFILASINNADCFDKDLFIKNADVLEIHIVYKDAKYLYYYKFLKGKWIKPEHFNSFDIENGYNTVSEGITKPKISSVLKHVLK